MNPLLRVALFLGAAILLGIILTAGNSFGDQPFPGGYGGSNPGPNSPPQPVIVVK